MKSFSYVVKDAMGIHARPAGLLVKAAKPFASTITISCGSKKVSAKALMAVMSMGVKKGMEVTVSAEGADEAAAIDGMQKFFEQNL